MIPPGRKAHKVGNEKSSGEKKNITTGEVAADTINEANKNQLGESSEEKVRENRSKTEIREQAETLVPHGNFSSGEQERQEMCIQAAYVRSKEEARCETRNHTKKQEGGVLETNRRRK